jgi:hypothetical protein
VPGGKTVYAQPQLSTGPVKLISARGGFDDFVAWKGQN